MQTSLTSVICLLYVGARLEQPPEASGAASLRGFMKSREPPPKWRSIHVGAVRQSVSEHMIIVVIRSMRKQLVSAVFFLEK